MTDFEKQMLDLVGDLKSEMSAIKAQNATLTQGIQAIAIDAQQKNEAYKIEIAKRDEEFAKVYKYLTENLSYRNLCTSSKSGIKDILTKEDVSDIWANFQTTVDTIVRLENDVEKRLKNINSNILLIRK